MVSPGQAVDLGWVGIQRRKVQFLDWEIHLTVKIQPAKENLRVFYLLMLLFCGTRSLKPVVGSLQSPIQSS